MIECPNCGAQNPVSESFCALCGSALHGGYQLPAGGSSRGHTNAAAGAARTRQPPREKAPRPEYSGSIVGFLTRPQEAYAYHAREGPKAAFPTFLLFGAVWAVITAICIAYLLPVVIDLDPAEFPVFSALQENVLLLVIFVIFLWILWMAALLVQALITSCLSRLFSPSASIPEGIAIVMRSSLAFAFIGWIPIIGMFAASIWAAVSTILGLKTTQDVSTGGAAVSAAVGVIAVYLLLFIIGGGFA